MFGRVVEGMETVDKIREVKTLPGDRPRTPVGIAGAVLEGAPGPVKKEAAKKKFHQVG